MVVEYLPSLKDNPYFSAGFGLVGVGTGLALLRKCAQYGFVLFRRNYMMTMEIPSKDKSYEWVLRWISLNTLRTRHISVETFYKQHDNGKITTEFNFIPSLGNHFFLYQNYWIKMERNRESNVVDLNTGTPWESLTLTTLGKNPLIFKNLLDESRTLALKNLGDKTVLYTAIGTDWRTFGFPRKKRPIESVILDTTISESIVNDIKDFIQSSKWYSDRGIPYRRGYLLYGPPGCGKSSFIKALAGLMNYSICVLNLSERGLTDDRLNHLLTVAPEQSIILLEDVDAAFASREDSALIAKAYEGLSRLTFSGLLNALDGVAAAEARILFMTTNYYDRLDPALIRPGRVDFTQYIGYATDYQLVEMFKKFYPNCSNYQAESFCKKTRDQLNGKQISAAQVQGYFMFNKEDPEGALKFVKNITQIENKHTSHDDKIKVA